MDEKLSIRLNIADRYYPLKVDRNEEERLRKAAKLINDRILQYKQKYTSKEAQDFMAMVSLQFATKYLECEEKLDESPIIEKISNLNSELEDFLQDTE
ncbi:MAG: cell division protein ZapA [Bacteroidetes bacterium]|nr:MAG: cell division protein ZapA [Bacteroidota bacterium]RLD79229.1 MAG: cell division protein ZapA [Bacteroidota bacterium]